MNIIKYRKIYYKEHKQKVKQYNRRYYLKWKAKGKYKDYYRKNRQKYYGVSIKTRYGITYEEYLKKVKNQNNRCAICNERFKKINLCVDHCHITGKIRGLLCKRCNLGIGALQDNVERLYDAIQYLQIYN